MGPFSDEVGAVLKRALYYPSRFEELFVLSNPHHDVHLPRCTHCGWDAKLRINGDVVGRVYLHHELLQLSSVLAQGMDTTAVSQLHAEINQASWMAGYIPPSNVMFTPLPPHERLAQLELIHLLRRAA